VQQQASSWRSRTEGIRPTHLDVVVGHERRRRALEAHVHAAPGQRPQPIQHLLRHDIVPPCLAVLRLQGKRLHCDTGRSSSKLETGLWVALWDNKQHRPAEVLPGAELLSQLMSRQSESADPAHWPLQSVVLRCVAATAAALRIATRKRRRTTAWGRLSMSACAAATSASPSVDHRRGELHHHNSHW